MTFIEKVLARLMTYSHQRFVEPIVVIESDDWGLQRHNYRFDEVSHLGKLKKWAYDDLETPEDLNDLYKVFEQFKDDSGDSFKITANFIVSNPDFKATAEASYKEIKLKHITDSNLLDHWKDGMERGVFWPQYHGRFHFNYMSMLKGIESAESTERKLFDAEFHGGLNNMSDTGWNDHSEYINWKFKSEPSVDETIEWINKGMAVFKEAFGFGSESVIAPHYVFSPLTAKAFAKAGFKYVQGGNHEHFLDSAGNKVTRRFPLGSRFYDGLVLIGRNVKFEPSRGIDNWGVDGAYRSAVQAIQNKIPAVVDSHRINYSGRHKELGLAKLNELLAKLQKHNVRCLSTDELGEALANDGHYTNRSTGKQMKLTPISGFFTKVLKDRMR